LRVFPQGGRDERGFYDAQTFHLIRRETSYLDHLVVTTYDDYRTAAGVTQAYRTTYSDGHPENDSVSTIRSTDTGARPLPGRSRRAKTIVPTLQIGPIVMTDVAVDALPFTWANDEHMKVVGLLGFDFLAGGVFKIDYENGTVDAMRYDAALPKDAFAVDAVLDDGVPMIPLTVNGVIGERFILDTGSDDVVLFNGFAKQHPEVVKDHSPQHVISREFNLLTSEGVGGELHTRALALEHMRLGTVQFNDFFSEVMSGDQPAFEGEDTDGLIGASVLSAFDVYLDYANSRVAFALNASAKKHRPARGLGTE
jgi:hypothetical protein